MLDMIAILKTKWISPPKPVTQSFEGKTILVTGATSGIGLEAVTKFAGLGASKIIMAARDLKKGDSTKLAIEDRVGRKDQLEVWKLDMTSYESIAAFAKRAETLDQLDIAVMNAGVTKANFKQSEYGWEESVQVNTLSTILLGVLLLPKLQASQRVTGRTSVLEFVNTGLHRNAIVSPEAQKQSSILQWYNKAENFSSMSQYTFSKLFLMHATTQLAKEVSSENVTITSICPGVVKTDISREQTSLVMRCAISTFGALMMNPPEVGANPILSGTIQGQQSHGRFWKSDKIQDVGLSLAGDANQKLGLRIWGEMADALTKEVPGFPSALEAIKDKNSR